jgi:hypothetical protein
VVAKVEWHPGELCPRVGFVVTNMSRPAENVVAFSNKRGTCEQWINHLTVLRSMVPRRQRRVDGCYANGQDEADDDFRRRRPDCPYSARDGGAL